MTNPNIISHVPSADELAISARQGEASGHQIRGEEMLAIKRFGKNMLEDAGISISPQVKRELTPKAPTPETPIVPPYEPTDVERLRSPAEMAELRKQIGLL